MLQPSHRPPPLEAAVENAVGESLGLVDSLQARVDAALRALETIAERARMGVGGDKGATEVIEAFQRELHLSRGEAANLFERQRKVLGTVNVALFGRTGAGKSSLIEALVHGDGATVSTSESDFTTEVRPVAWRGCRFIDTPGTNGWGRSASRDLLEGRAREAVEVADVVVLCFDTQSQQKGEFEKIGSWVKEYGKPVVAVLNVRNPMWRRPSSVPLGSQRRRLSRAVREHVTNIDTELAALGIFGSPVVAMSAQRAVYARVVGPYRGPAVEQFNKLCEELGPEALLHGSNFEVLEAVIVEALTHHASELRLGMLHAQVRALLERLGRALDKANDDAKTAAAILDRTIEGLFAVVGYPTKGSAARDAFPKEQRREEDLLSWVERMRGGPYEVKAQGKLFRYVQQRLEAEIGALRARSLSAADEAVVSAFEERRDLDSDEFSRAVFQLPQIQTACERVAKEAAEFVRRETRLVVDDGRLDLEFVFGAGSPVAGTSGKTRRIVGYAAIAGGVLSGVASTLMGVALLDPEPLSKVALAAGAFIAGLGAMVLGWFGTKQRKKAEEARQRAWAEAIASARRHVNDVYDGFAKQIANTAASMALEATVRLLADPLARAGGLWTLSAEGATATSSLRQLRDELPASADPQRVLKEAAASVVAGLYTGDAAGAALALLGESWICDPLGLVADEGASEPARTRAYDPSLFERLFDGLRAFVDRFDDTVPRGAGTRWLEETEDLLAPDSEAVTALAELREISHRGLARIQLFGDYSSGKTSFVKRLLIDAGLPLPASLEVRADPTTDRVHLYEWEQVVLVDTPGLQSTNDAHGNAALDACPDASGVVYLLQPNLLVGSTSAVERLLKGDRAQGLAPKLDRTLFVIHRADELGADPEVVPEEYVRLCERKKTELQLALASRGIRVDEDRIFCMAADPYQLVGDRRDVSSAQFDRFRSWDGFREFRKTIRDINTKFSGTGVDRSLLEGGLARLGRLDASAVARRQKLALREGALSHLGVVLAEVLAEGERIDGAFRATARRMVDDHASSNLERVAGAASDAELEATANQLAGWWKLPAFEGDAERWQSEAKAAIDEWFQRSVDRLERTVNAPRFKAAVAGAGETFDPAAFGVPGQGWLRGVLNLVAKPLKGATRDVVYWVGKALGANFRPWGAVKLARLLGSVGVVLGVITTVFDAINLYRGWKGEQRRAELRKKLRGFVDETAAQVLRSLVDGNEEAAGAMTYLKAVQDHLRATATDLESDRSRLFEEIGILEAKRGRFSARMAKAWAALGYEEDEA
jgi:predicted GTPase